MKFNIKYLFPMTLVLFLGIGLAVPSQVAKAASLIGTSSQVTDTDGSVTGTSGATYYNTASWQDMLDTYKAAPTGTTVYFNITGDVPGSSVMTNSNNVINGKSLTIIGNKHTLYVDGDTNYTTGNDIQSGNAWGSQGTISSATTLKVQNASIINNVTGGIFQMQGSGAQATCIYQDVTVQNGANRSAAQPIRNDNGKILFYGNNTFNILTDQNFSDNTMNGADNNGEWIQGGAWFEVVNGTTTLNQSWGNDQPLYTYGNTQTTMKVDDNAHLVWNLNNTYCMYYDDGNSGPMNWDIGNNASFDLNGTANTASHYSYGWFYGVANNVWNVNVGTNSRLAVTTGGGYINLNGFNGGKVNWTVGNGSQVLVNNLNKSSTLFYGAPASGSGITLNDPQVVTFNTVGGAVFNSNVGNNFPITISGNGLRTHASSTAATFPTIGVGAGAPKTPTVPDLLTPNQNMFASTDVWYRQNIGSIKGIGATMTNSLTPTPYSSADMTYINKAAYLSWYQPNGYWNNAGMSNMAKTFNISLDPTATNGTPLNGSWSGILPGTAATTLVVGDDRGQAPSFNVSVKQLSLNSTYAKGLQFYWTDPTSGNSTQLTTGTAVPVASVTSDSSLPSWMKMTGAGAFYTMTFPANQGLTLKARNNLLLASNADVGTFQYTIADGPA